MTTQLTRRTIIKGLATVPVAGTALTTLPGLTRAQDDAVTVGSKDFTE